MATCRGCGQAVDRGDNFCPSCTVRYPAELRRLAARGRPEGERLRIRLRNGEEWVITGAQFAGETLTVMFDRDAAPQLPSGLPAGSVVRFMTIRVEDIVGFRVIR